MNERLDVESFCSLLLMALIKESVESTPVATVASETVKAGVDWLLDSMAALIIHTEQPSDSGDLRAGRTSAS